MKYFMQFFTLLFPSIKSVLSFFFFLQNIKKTQILFLVVLRFSCILYEFIFACFRIELNFIVAIDFTASNGKLFFFSVAARYYLLQLL